MLIIHEVKLIIVGLIEQCHAKVALFPALISLTEIFSFEYVLFDKGYEFHCIIMMIVFYTKNNAKFSV